MTKRLMTAWVVLALAGAGTVLVGCGQKGELFLPGENPNPATPLLDDDADAPLASPVEAKTTDEPSDMSGESASDGPADTAADDDN
ncbi:LPS translocon maturation chaperone LptM [Salinisphaera japonica]|nr:lipoprotein [Salinisphaera japonica]